MADSRQDTSASHVETDDRGSTGDPSIGAAMALTVLGAAAGAAAAWCFFRIYASGDEAPIRVKGGSLELHLLSKTAVWKKTGQSFQPLPPGTRGNDRYQVFVSKSGGGGPHAQGTVVELVHNDGNVVTIKSAGNHSLVSPSNILNVNSSNAQLLEYPAGGYLKDIKVDGTSMGPFSDTDNAEAVLLDY